jgi:phosphatidate cytidylyltransferase
MGYFREHAMSLMCILGILAVTFAVVDNWYRLFVALTPFTITTMAVVALLNDRPKGYIQRLATGVLAFVLFGVCLGHLSFMGNDANYRPIVLLLLLSVQLNDVFAFVLDRTIGGPKLAPKTIPTKTVAGFLGAVILTAVLVTHLTGIVFEGESLSRIGHRIMLGIIVSLTAQFGELTIAAVKCDIGIADRGSYMPGRGGFLDRANGLLFSAPALYHYVNYFRGIGDGEQVEIFSTTLFGGLF